MVFGKASYFYGIFAVLGILLSLQIARTRCTTVGCQISVISWVFVAGLMIVGALINTGDITVTKTVETVVFGLIAIGVVVMLLTLVLYWSELQA